MATVIDTLVTRLQFKSDNRALSRTQKQLERFKAGANRSLAAVGRGIRVGGIALAALGGAALFSGTPTERELLKLQTQLGLTAEQADNVRTRARAISEDYNTPLQQTTAAFFSLLSAGLSLESAQESLTASAKGWQAQMGNVRDLAHVAGGAVNAYGADVVSGTRAMEIMNATVKEGNLVAEDLLLGFGELLQIAPQLGIGMEQLGAVIAGGTRSGIKANIVMTQLRQIMIGTLQAMGTKKKRWEDLGISVEDFNRRVSEDLIGALQWLRLELGDDQGAMLRLFESTEAVGLIMDITGRNSSAYREVLDGVTNSVGVLDKASTAYAESGLSKQESATNAMKLALDDLYQNALIPLLGLFGKLPDKLQLVAVAFGGAGLMASLFGISLGPLLLGLALFVIKMLLLALGLGLVVFGIKWILDNTEAWKASLVGVGAVVLGLFLAFGLLGLKIGLVIALLVGTVIVIREVVAGWNDLTRAIGRFLEAYRQIPLLGGLQRFGADAGQFVAEKIIEPMRSIYGGNSLGGLDLSGGRGDLLSALQNARISPLATSPAALADIYAGYAPEGRSAVDSRDQSVTFTEGAIVVNAAPGQSEVEIGQVAARAMIDEYQIAVEQFDSDILR